MFDLSKVIAASRTLLAMTIIFGFLAIVPAHAQNPDRPPTPVTGFNPDKAEVHADEFKGGGPLVGNIVIPDQKAASLIQDNGRTWRDYRRGPLLWFVVATVPGVLVLLLLFRLIRGRVMIDGGLAHRLITRFGSFERFMHWLTAFSWLILALSGLNEIVGRRVLLPLVGNEMFTTLSTAGKYAHNFVAFPFMIGVVLMFFVWVRHNLPEMRDIDWFAQGGGLIGAGRPSAGKFNAGQKMVFWIVVLGGTGLSLTGLAMLFPFSVTDIAGMQLISVVHGGIALLMIAAMLGHIYIGTVGMEGAVEAMTTGDVDLNWAREHHDLWVEEVTAKSHPAE